MHIKNITKHRRIISERRLQCGENLAEECKGVVIEYISTASEKKEMKQTKQRVIDNFGLVYNGI